MTPFRLYAEPKTTLIEWQRQLNMLIEKLSPNINLGETGVFYFGDKDTDGTWKIIRSGNNLITQRRESGAWVTKNTITP